MKTYTPRRLVFMDADKFKPRRRKNSKESDQLLLAFEGYSRTRWHVGYYNFVTGSWFAFGVNGVNEYTLALQAGGFKPFAFARLPTKLTSIKPNVMERDNP